MNINKLPAKIGYLWFKQGLWLFGQNPFIFLIGSLCSVFLIMPLLIVGEWLLSPFIRVGFMAVCRNKLNQKSTLPATQPTLHSIYNKKTVARLLLLGLYEVFALLISVILTLLIVSIWVNPNHVIQYLTTENYESLYLLWLCAVVIRLIIYRIFRMLTRFAPALIAWHRMPVHKALSLSMTACWRNLSAIMLSSLLWLLCLSAAYILAFGILFMLNVNTLVFVVLALAIPIFSIPILWCMNYVSYVDCFSPEIEALSDKLDPNALSLMHALILKQDQMRQE
ncbi:BPSS1780 family membrane protein [Mycoavidus sp. B2-EB]|uniref:BPSS1780 family membrane protein n=1 Tax=Mycoavidus sp. B2-EB TaxID=2651972 RepID=UPI001627F917|nr:BPSS1780 family membrane protein [Mycoavidus sp. B2-EB]BBO59678.1 hypothetical protein MPB2EB_0802 [Mycoavidus sp. B2-EB]